MKSMTKLMNQIAVVTGASGGIGGAIAAQLAHQGAILCLVGRDKQRITNATALWQAASPNMEVYQCDLAKDRDIEALQQQICTRHARIDILVHSAGIIDHGKLEDAPITSFDQQYNTNVRGPLLLTQKLLPLLGRPGGQIVFINSSAGLNANANAGYYSACKHALRAAADSLRDEVNAEGIRVLSVFPGRTATPLMEALYRKENRPYQPDLLLQAADVANVVINALTLPWTAEVTNISIRPMHKS
jgi:NADP-dependent 3-hydroxy acid dehydrogenase YdfG